MRLPIVSSFVAAACVLISVHPKAATTSAVVVKPASSVTPLTNSCRAEARADSNSSVGFGLASETKVIAGPQIRESLREKLQGPKGVHLRRAFDLLYKAKGVRVDLNAAWGIVGPSARRAKGVMREPEAPMVRPIRQQWSWADGNTTLYFIPGNSQDGSWTGTFEGGTCDSGSCADIIINVEQHFDEANGNWYGTWEQLVYTDDDRGQHQWVSLDGRSEEPQILRARYEQPQRFSVRPAGLRVFRDYGNWLGCGMYWCGGMALGCAAAHWWNAEIGWGPCTGASCIGSYIGCSWGTIFRWV
jgi:hypothetical protein